MSEEHSYPLNHATVENCVSTDLKRRLRLLSPKNRKAVLQMLLLPGWVLSSPAREERIRHLELLVELMDEREQQRRAAQ